MASTAAGPSSSAAGRRRVALYFAPLADSVLAVTASRWLGRTAETAHDSGGLAVPGVPGHRLQRYRAAPFHYGFHATLKPPFQLRDGVTIDEVGDCVERVCAVRRAVVLPPMQVAELNDFICLRPVASCPAIGKLAADLVERLDWCRRPPDAAELARRRRAGLSVRQQQLLLRWGYPYVLDEFRFHLTLTGALTDNRERAKLRRFLEDLFAEALQTAVVVDRVSLFVEDDGRPLILSAAYPLAAGGESGPS